MAQAIRAILFASAMAATFVGRRANNALSQGLCLVPWILGQRSDSAAQACAAFSLKTAPHAVHVGLFMTTLALYRARSRRRFFCVFD
jgi:hypothetical protein